PMRVEWGAGWCGGGAELEEDGPAAVDADVGREALDARIAGAADVPLGGGITGQTVLGFDGVRRRGAGGNGCLRTGEQEESAREKHFGPLAVEAAVRVNPHFVCPHYCRCFEVRTAAMGILRITAPRRSPGMLQDPRRRLPTARP